MAPPPHGTIVAAIDQLHRDADAWRVCAGQLRAGSLIAGFLGLGGYEFSYPAAKAGLQHTYLLLQQKMVGLCDEAAANFENVGAALDLAADGYDHDERAAVHELRKAW
jgi:hypothetical protein